jgi:hypothetical protein
MKPHYWAIAIGGSGDKQHSIQCFERDDQKELATVCGEYIVKELNSGSGVVTISTNPTADQYRIALMNSEKVADEGVATGLIKQLTGRK